MIFRLPAIAALSGLLALGACTDPGGLNDPNDPNRNRNQGVLLGAGLGALVGNLAGGDTEATMAGAVVGGLAGGLVGNELDKQERDLRASVGDGRVKITNTGDRLIVTLPQDILFATDSFAVSPDLQDDLRAVSANLQSYPNSVVQVIGHTDNTGDAGYNLDLSQRRANAVANLLIASGTSASRVETVGRGESTPVASNLSPEGRALNRGVEIVILPTA